MDEADAADLMNLVRNELGFARQEKRFPRKATLLKVYSHTVNAQTPLTDVVERHFPWVADAVEPMGQIFEQYTRRKRAQNVLDYDDLLLLWRTLAGAPRVGDKLRALFDHVLVDEYQDTNAVQADILRSLRPPGSNLMVVGDDAQSIYSFRAATVRNILDFPKQFPGTKTVTLEENYRSTQPILAASNAVMQYATERFTKDLWSSRTSDQKPVLVTCLDEEQQSQLICKHILEHREEGTLLMHQSVLFRASHHSAHLEIELTKRNIPFHKYGGLKFVEAAHIKDVLAVLRILENPADELSWFRVLQLLAGVGPRTASRIMAELGVQRLAPRPADTEVSEGDTDAAADAGSPLLRLAEQPPTVPPAAREDFDRLRATLAECASLRPGPAAADDSALPLAAQLERIRAFYEPVFVRLYDNPTIRLRDLEQLEQIATRYRSRQNFITDLTLDPPNSTSDLAQPPHLDEDYLILSTVHSAKGMEWTTVHIMHAADGMMPSDMATRDDTQIDEERRLFYVAMTRAKDMLYVYFPLRYYHHRFGTSDSHGYAQLTRFLPPNVRSLFEQRTADDVRDGSPGPTSVQETDDWLKQLWQ